MKALREKEKNFISAVVYVHNDESRISDFLMMLVQTLEGNFEHSEIICVNDCSEDHSLQAIRAVSEKAERTSISVVNMSHFHGLELAMNAGVDLAIGDFVMEFDNTLLDFGEAEIMRVYQRELEGYDLVYAIPDRRERHSSHLFYRVFSKFSNLDTQMHTESFHIVSRRLINRIMDMNKTVPYRKAVYMEAGLRADTIVFEGKANQSKISDKREKRYRASLALDSLILFTNVAYRFSFIMTMLLMLMSIIMIVYSVIVYATAHPVAGWTTTILFLSVAFFGLFGILTVIIKYLQLLVNLVLKRKQYSFYSIEKLTK